MFSHKCKLPFDLGELKYSEENKYLYSFLYSSKESDTFIQSDLQCIQVIHLYRSYSQYVCSLGIEPTTFCAANTMLYH